MEIFITVIVTLIASALLWLFLVNVSVGEKKITEPLRPDFSVGDDQFIRVMGGLLGPGIITGNRVKTLTNGDQIFPAMLDAIAQAKETICFETYIYWSGKIGERFSHLLSERAKAGVRVHVLLDWAGSAKIDEHYTEEMKKAGVEVERFHPLHWYTLSRLNNRTHRKLLIVDGKVGFTGGVGISDKWTGDAQDEEHWRDSHFQIEGPSVTQMQAAFIDNWIKVRGCVLQQEMYFPKIEASGSMRAQVFKSSRDEGSESVRLMYLMSIAAARKTIRLSASYFVPDTLAVETLVQARERGVEITIIVPGPKIDSSVTRRASRARWGKLLDAGIAIYEFQPTMYHCKILIVDDVWVSVGSTNFDNRSFRLNAEANLNILSQDFALEQARTFEQDKARSHRVTREEYDHRPLREKIIEHLAELFRSQL